MNDYVFVDGLPVEKNGYYICPFCLNYVGARWWGKHIKKCRANSITKGEVQRRFEYIKSGVVNQE